MAIMNAILLCHISKEIGLVRRAMRYVAAGSQSGKIETHHVSHCGSCSGNGPIPVSSCPHFIPPSMLSVIRDQGHCDLWGMSSSLDRRLLTTGSKGISLSGLLSTVTGGRVEAASADETSAARF